MKINQITQSSNLRTKGTTDHATREMYSVDFGTTDKRGRTIGAKIETCITEFTVLPDDYNGSYNRYPAGIYYACCIQITRDGLRYGASQGYNYFVDINSRQAYIDKRITTAKRQKH